MKEKALKESETKTVIVGTYAMASEALDIKTLTTLVFASPKTDVVQAVGRILRVKHVHVRPTVIDIIDSHDPFRNQWMKRRKYYKKEGYEIVTGNACEYNQSKPIKEIGWKLEVAGMGCGGNSGLGKSGLRDVDEAQPKMGGWQGFSVAGIEGVAKPMAANPIAAKKSSKRVNHGGPSVALLAK
jgi:superfamily II DNA or RNA helicase